MMLLIIGILAALLAGALVKTIAGTGWVDQWYVGHVEKRITWTEFLIGAAICSIIVVPFTAFVGNKIALASNLTYHEFWNGYEVSADRSDTECHKNGSCHFVYDCDPHPVVKTRTVPDADGKGSHTETYVETEYDSCPEATVEWEFQVRTTLGTFFVERTFPTDAQQYRGSHGLRDSVRRGVPPFWQAAADRIARGDPGPVTVKKDYDNYILASQSTILHKFSADLDQYRSILPAPANTRDVRDLYYTDKAYFVNMPAGPDLRAWSDAVMRFNAAFGSDLQGDLHLILVGADTVAPDQFTGALNAYWTSKTFDRDAISKNSLVVVVGTDGTTAKWVRAFTGMPRGNEQLLADIQRELSGKPLDPATLIGVPVGKIGADGKFETVVHSSGLLETQTWGPDEFARVCMTCAQEGGGGFTYLSGDIEISDGQRAAILAAAFVLSLIVWTVFVLIGNGNQEEDSDRTGRRNRGLDSFGRSRRDIIRRIRG